MIEDNPLSIGWKKTLIATTALILGSCGDTDFRGGTDSQSNRQGQSGISAPPENGEGTPFGNDDDATGTDLNPIDNVFALHWNLTCNGSSPVPTVSGIQTVTGPGPHTLALADNDVADLTIRGMPCPGANRPRDLLFVIDVSGSMDNSDPIVQDSCGRMQAIEKVVANTTTPDARFAILTFNGNVRVTSSTYFATLTELYDDLTAEADGDTPTEVICDDGGGTDYRDALTGAKELIETTADSNAQLEIYMISDGEPDNNREGIVQAQDLKDNGVIIGTVMLGDEDEVLEQAIASRDQADQPYHVKVDKADDLASVLEKLSQSFGSSPGKIRYRTDRTQAWTEAILPGQAMFSTAVIPLSLGETPHGVELEYEFFDPQLLSVLVQTGQLSINPK